MKDHLYLDNYDGFRKFANDGSTISSELQTQHIFLGDQRIALIGLDSTPGITDSLPLVHYLIEDQLSSASLELDDIGQLISYEEFSPYGSTTYFATTQVNMPKWYRFSAKERDSEIGLSYFGRPVFDAVAWEMVVT
jgi:hypothetical protein